MACGWTCRILTPSSRGHNLAVTTEPTSLEPKSSLRCREKWVVTRNAKQIHETTSNRMHRTKQSFYLKLQVIFIQHKMSVLTLSGPTMSLAIASVACSQMGCRITSDTEMFLFPIRLMILFSNTFPVCTCTLSSQTPTLQLSAVVGPRLTWVLHPSTNREVTRLVSDMASERGDGSIAEKPLGRFQSLSSSLERLISSIAQDWENAVKDPTQNVEDDGCRLIHLKMRKAQLLFSELHSTARHTHGAIERLR